MVGGRDTGLVHEACAAILETRIQISGHKVCCAERCLTCNLGSGVPFLRMGRDGRMRAVSASPFESNVLAVGRTTDFHTLPTSRWDRHKRVGCNLFCSCRSQMERRSCRAEKSRRNDSSVLFAAVILGPILSLCVVCTHLLDADQPGKPVCTYTSWLPEGISYRLSCMPAPSTNYPALPPPSLSVWEIRCVALCWTRKMSF